MSSSDTTAAPTTNVPAPTLTDAGFTAPSEQDMLAGALADMNAALGGGANTALSTPQGQIALSETAILGDALSLMLGVFNGVDPATASGRMQEAIGRIYFIERRPATATTVTVQASVNGPGQTIPAGTVVAQGSDGSLYAAPQALTLPGTAGTTTLTLACQTTGAITCPAGSLTLYQAGLGLSSLTNTSPGATGADAESRADFEARRSASVAGNSVGQNASLLGALLALNDVTDAYVTDNPTGDSVVLGGVTIPPHALYCVVAGGTAAEIGQAILTHKAPGCDTAGSQSVTVQDTNPAYGGHGPSYTYHYDTARIVAVAVHVQMLESVHVPSNATALITSAVLASLGSGINRPRLGGSLYGYRLASAINALGDWAEVVELTLSADNGPALSRLTLNINELASITADMISVEYG